MRLVTRVIALSFLVFLSIQAFADTLTGKVVKITDGDTICVLDAKYQATQDPSSRDRGARTKAGLWTGLPARVWANKMSRQP